MGQAAQKTATDDEVVAEITPAGKANFAAPGKPAVKRPSPSDDSDSEEVEELAKKRKETGTTSGKKESKPIKVDASFLKNIDLEVLELRASLDFQGLHRDSIEDICDEKRQRLVEEYEASVAASAGGKSEASGKEEQSPSVDGGKQEKEKEKEKDKDKKRRDDEKTKDKDKEKDKAKEKPAAKEKEKEKEKEKKEKEKQAQKNRSKSRGKDK